MLRKELKELQASRKKYLLVKWHGEDAFSIVDHKDIFSPNFSDISVGSECQVWYKKKLHLAKVKAMGSKAEVEKKEEELVQELTAPTELCAGKKRPQDSTAQKEPPHKKRRKDKENKVQTSDSKKPAKKEKAKSKKKPGSIIKISAHVTPSAPTSSPSDLPASSDNQNLQAASNDKPNSSDSRSLSSAVPPPVVPQPSQPTAPPPSQPAVQPLSQPAVTPSAPASSDNQNLQPALNDKPNSSESRSLSSEDSIKSLPPPLPPLRIQTHVHPAVPPPSQLVVPQPSQPTAPPPRQPALSLPCRPIIPPPSQPAFQPPLTSLPEPYSRWFVNDTISSKGSDDMDLSSEEEVNDSDSLLLEIVIEDLSDRVEKMEDKLNQIERNQLLIMDRLTSLEETRGPAVQSHHAYPWANFHHSPVSQGHGYNQQSFVPPRDLSHGYNQQNFAPPVDLSHGYSQQNFAPPPRSTADPAVHPYHSTPHRRVQEAPQSLPIKVKNSENALPSSEIDTTKLSSVDMVITKYSSKLKGEAKAPTLAMKLAKEAIFGDEVMKKCTPVGGRDLPGLPVVELQMLKQAMFNKFPQYWQNPCEFEGIWSDCMSSIGQACKRLRGQ